MDRWIDRGGGEAARRRRRLPAAVVADRDGFNLAVDPSVRNTVVIAFTGAEPPPFDSSASEGEEKRERRVGARARARARGSREAAS